MTGQGKEGKYLRYTASPKRLPKKGAGHPTCLGKKIRRSEEAPTVSFSA